MRSRRPGSARARWPTPWWATSPPGARAVFFADNLLVNAAFVAAGLWFRDLIVLVMSGSERGQLLTELTVYSPLQALTTALFALLLLVTFREWFSIRLDA